MKRSIQLLSAMGGLGAVLLLAAPASAQTETPPTEGSTTPPPVAASSSSHSSGGGAGIGVGATAWLSGLAGGQFVYDQDLFDIDAVFAFGSTPGGMNTRNTGIQLGVSGWYHLHHGSNADFSLGAGLGFANASGGGTSVQAFVVEPGAQIRVFLTPNVALHGRVGLAMAFGDNGTAAGPASSVALIGQTTAAVGFTYFFR